MGKGVWVGVMIRVRVGVRIWVKRTGREVERKRKKCEEKINTTKGQNVFIRFKIEKTKKN